MAQESDRVDAFGDLYSATFTRVLGYCRRRARSDTDADDAVAETYLIAWRRLDKVLAADSQLAWLFGVAYRVLSNQYRTADRAERLRQRIRLQRPRTSEPGPVQTFEDNSDVVAVYSALGQLNAVDQELIRLAALEELTYAEIAAVLGMRVGAVRSRLFRARRRLDEMVQRSDSPGDSQRDGPAEPDTHSDEADSREPPEPPEEKT